MADQNKQLGPFNDLSRRDFLKDLGLVLGGTALASSASLLGCSSAGATETVTNTVTTTQKPPTTPPLYRFFFVPHSHPHPFWNTQQAGALQAGKDFNVSVNYTMFPIYTITDMVNRINEVRALKPDGLVITVPDQNALDTPVRAIINDGVPVIAVNTPDSRPPLERIPYLFYVGANETVSGGALIREILKVRKPKKVLIAAHIRGMVSLEQRITGAQNELDSAGVPYDLVEVTTDPSTIQNRITSYFATNPDTDAIFNTGHTPEVSITNDFLKQTGRLGNVLQVTYDYDSTTAADLKSGALLAISDQQVFLQGWATIAFLYLYKKYGFTLGDNLSTGPFMITKDNVDAVQAGIAGGWR
jgi:simple sugar transport system substrate-binding protein